MQTLTIKINLSRIPINVTQPKVDYLKKHKNMSRLSESNQIFVKSLIDHYTIRGFLTPLQYQYLDMYYSLLRTNK